MTLKQLEWTHKQNEVVTCQRILPNGIKCGIKVISSRDVRMEMWLTNGTKKILSDLRVQNCAMLKGAKSFDQQTNNNKVFPSPYATCKSDDEKRWIIQS